MRAGQHWAGEPDRLKQAENRQALAENDTTAADPAEAGRKKMQKVFLPKKIRQLQVQQEQMQKHFLRKKYRLLSWKRRKSHRNSGEKQSRPVTQRKKQKYRIWSR